MIIITESSQIALNLRATISYHIVYAFIYIQCECELLIGTVWDE